MPLHTKKTSILALLVLTLFIMTALFKAPTLKASEDSVIYINSEYTVNAYLYDDDGVLRYGIPVAGDERFMWETVSENEGYGLRNVGSGNFIRVQGDRTDTEVVSGTLSDPDFLWDFDPSEDESQNITSLSDTFSSHALNVEGSSDGYVNSRLPEGVQLSWGNVKWYVYESGEVNFEAMRRDGFVIESRQTGELLYADDGGFSFSAPSEPDEGFIFDMVETDGFKAVVNKKTGEALTVQTPSTSPSLALQADADPSWNFALGLDVDLRYESPDAEPLNLSFDGATISLEPSDGDSESQRFNIRPAASVPNVVGDLTMPDNVYNLKNAWYNMYLIEEDGVATYGNADPSDPKSQWRFLYDEATGHTALRNEESGNYLKPGDTVPLEVSAGEVYHWNLLRNQSDLYPESVVFQDKDTLSSYMHMENLEGHVENSPAVQPTWGTPHWEAVVAGESNVNFGETVEVGEDFVRIKNTDKANAFLYQTASGSVAYGQIGEGDALSHWQFLEYEDITVLVNRESGLALKNMGNGVLRMENHEEVPTRGMDFEVVSAPLEGGVLIRNVYPDMPTHQLPYLNTSSDEAFVRSSLVSVESRSTQWTLTEAGEVEQSTASEDATSIYLETFEESRRYRIKGRESKYALEHFGSYTRIRNTDSNDYLTIEKGEVEEKPFTRLDDTSLLFTVDVLQGELRAFSNDTSFALEPTKTTHQYSAEDAYQYDDYTVFTVYAEAAGTFNARLTSNTPMGNTEFFLNGDSIDAPEFKGSLSTKTFELSLNQGINTLKVKTSGLLDRLSVESITGNQYRGASTTLRRYEAETMDTTADFLNYSTTYREIQSEASGREAIEINRTGQYVRFTLNADTDLMNVRYSIPDSEDGNGQTATLNLYADGEKIDAFDMSSEKTWLYGPYPWSNDPGEGSPHVFFDETTLKLDQPLEKGTEITIRKDVENYASTYVIDFVETSMQPEALVAPVNSVDITDFGAIAGDNESDKEAFLAALDEAISTGAPLFIPSGRFIVDGTIDIDGAVSIFGAGREHTYIEGINFRINSDNVSFYDFAMLGSAVTRRDEIDPAAFEDGLSSTLKNITIQNIDATHYKVGIWINDIENVHIVGNRFTNTFADGMNLHAGVTNAVVEQNRFRNTGDDAIGLWSEGLSNEQITIRHNTIEIPWLANGIAVYGGKDISVTDNLISDTVYAGAGINISTNFQPTPFENDINVARNTLLRTGSDNNGGPVGGIWFNTLSGFDNFAEVNVFDNLILDSSYQGVSFQNGGYLAHVFLNGNVITNSGTYGIEALDGTEGNAYIRNTLMSTSAIDDFIKQEGSQMQFSFADDSITYDNPISLTSIIVHAGVTSVLLGVTGFMAFKAYKTYRLYKEKGAQS